MSYLYKDYDMEDVSVGVEEGEEWDTLILNENSKIFKGIEWDETWGDMLLVKITRTLDDNGLPNSDWYLGQVLNTFEEEVELPSDILSIVENYLINERN